MITYSQLRKVDTRVIESMSSLMSQLSGEEKRVSRGFLSQVFREKNTVLLVAWDGKKIVGMGTLAWLFVPGGLHARIEDVIVDEKYRGQGIGRKLMEKLIARAKRKKIAYIDLTSNPSRKAAIQLYGSMGFKKKETNSFRFVC